MPALGANWFFCVAALQVLYDHSWYIPLSVSQFSSALDGMRDTRQAGQKAAELLLKYHKSINPMTAWQMKEYRRSIMAKHYR